MAKALPTHAELVEYKHAVAGHDGTLCDVDGTLFIKPCTQAEVDFYEESVASHPDFLHFMPTYLGTLSLTDAAHNGTVEEQCDALLAKHAHGIPPVEPGSIPVAKRTVPEVVPSKTVGKRIVTNQAIVLANAASGFVKPNILDVKLGVRLYADDASPEKKARFDKVSAETTHKDLGFRIAGMRVWQGEGATGDVDEDGYKIYDKNFGRLSVTKDNVEDAFRSYIFSHAAGIDDELGKLICEAFLTDCREIQAVLEGQESRMFSASLLFVFEGDGVALRKALEEATSKGQAKAAISPVNGFEETEEGDDDDEEEEEDELAAKAYAVHVIDFAHATWVPGQGPDDNALKGVRSVVQILDNLLK
ncbi:putative inositol polyphosphate multikinase [Bisporella sp. PMI_857]|nr:putative inositol polyphosphate multikinase [Bisporella sp. PMI_857]